LIPESKWVYIDECGVKEDLMREYGCAQGIGVLRLLSVVVDFTG